MGCANVKQMEFMAAIIDVPILWENNAQINAIFMHYFKIYGMGIIIYFLKIIIHSKEIIIYGRKIIIYDM